MDKSKLNWGLMSGIYLTAETGRKYNPAGLGGLLETRLRLDDSLVTRLDLAVYDSLVIRQAGQRSDKTRWPNGRFMKAGSYYDGPV